MISDKNSAEIHPDMFEGVRAVWERKRSMDMRLAAFDEQVAAERAPLAAAAENADKSMQRLLGHLANSHGAGADASSFEVETQENTDGVTLTGRILWLEPKELMETARSG